MDKNIVITVSRLYGSGGRMVAEALSKRLNIPYYDKDLIKLASDESGINEALFANSDEKVKGNFLMKLGKTIYDGELISPESKDFTSDKNLFAFQAKVIKKLADTESCIIVGRCAEFVLKDYDNVLSVFIHAPHDFCLERAAEKKDLPFNELEEFVNKTNKGREEYHKRHTGTDWSDARNYDLCLDSSKLGIDRCVDEIVSYIKVRFGE